MTRILKDLKIRKYGEEKVFELPKNVFFTVFSVFYDAVTKILIALL